jgi:hypothetical protein
MANKNFPGPNINRLIETDPQIVKVGMDYFGWGSRSSIFGQLKGDVRSNNPAPPHAPEMTIKHVGNEK